MTRSEIMSRIRGKNTKPELLVRRKFRELGFVGYRLHYGPYRIDVAFVGKRIAVFMDSCFWHGCAEHFRMPKTNTDFWSAKIERNKERDKEVDCALKEQGWKVVRIWEHQLDGNLDDLLLDIFMEC